MNEHNGKLQWVFPDCELPPPGDSLLKGHESIIVLNMNNAPASIEMKLYFADREPVSLLPAIVEAERVRCFRLDHAQDMGGYVIPKETQYAVKLTSSVPVVVQYGRLDTRQQDMAFYTTMGLSV
ncbi:sensory rhodopsin transducer [Paenibacillus sp. J5C_2022]|uniref:sensory rhodopsin transducer n=1 Tax=Paenibacillus sp. J5C2022 TaxID=2977129 RepID=UPI0021D167B3|nr:sensory rhodopsin transducer [Paenibacillus sp. J5C2022]MCU6709630.1 sensory rhodopsin transducer [Paenibacillus sp. J5C2022]